MSDDVDPIVDPNQDERVRALTTEVATLKRRLARVRGGEELILEAVSAAFSEPTSLVVPRSPGRSRKKNREEALLHLTDTQVGKLTEDYSAAVAEERIIKAVRKTVKITDMRRSEASIDRCVLFLGGDMVEGENIFPGQAHHLDSGVFEQAVKHTPAMIARAILLLLESFPEVVVKGVCGNHGRAASRSVGSHPKTNWDRVCYEVAKLMLLGNEVCPRKELAGRLRFDIPDAFYAHEFMFDWGVLAVHGDQIRGGFAGFPWYGVGRKSYGWIDSIPEPWDVLLIGHFHQIAGAIINSREWLCGGTTESGNEYARNELASVGHPTQRLYFLSAEDGIIADCRLYLGEGRVPQRQRRGGGGG
jgi:hypothetical protein